MRSLTEDERRERRGALAYNVALGGLGARGDDACLVDGLMTLEEYRVAYEQVRSFLLDYFPELDGPEIGDLLYEAAGEVWPTVNPQL